MLQRAICLIVLLAVGAFGQTNTSNATPESGGLVPNEKLVGLWCTEQMYGPLVRGELTIDSRPNEWQANIAGFDAVVQHDEQQVSLKLPGDRGEFRGRLSADKTLIVGQWIQAPGATVHQRYASPVRLKGIASGVWRGVVVPLDDRVSFFLTIDRTTSGGITAYIRNPEHNWFGRGTYEVRTTGNTIALTRG